MTFTLTIDMDNAAFETPQELARLLGKVRNRALELSGTKALADFHGRLLDINGHTVGKYEVAP